MSFGNLRNDLENKFSGSLPVIPGNQRNKPAKTMKSKKGSLFGLIAKKNANRNSASPISKFKMQELHKRSRSSTLDMLKKKRMERNDQLSKDYKSITLENITLQHYKALVKLYPTEKKSSFRMNFFKREVQFLKKGQLKKTMPLSRLSNLVPVAEPKTENRKVYLSSFEPKSGQFHTFDSIEDKLVFASSVRIMKGQIGYSPTLCKIAEAKNYKKCDEGYYKLKLEGKLNLSVTKKAINFNGACALHLSDKPTHTLKLFCCTWYMRGMKPLAQKIPKYAKILKKEFCCEEGTFQDMYVFNVQELPEDFVGGDYFTKILGEDYYCVASEEYLGNGTYIFAKTEYAQRVLNIETTVKKLNYKYKKKQQVIDTKPRGIIAIGLQVYTSSLLFVNMQLFEESYGDTIPNIEQRKEIMQDALSSLHFDKKQFGMDETDILSNFEYKFIAGNLNFRSMTKEVENVAVLKENDSLYKILEAKDKIGSFLSSFEEQDISKLTPRKVNVSVSMFPNRILYDIPVTNKDISKMYYTSPTINSSPDFPVCSTFDLELSIPPLSALAIGTKQYTLSLNFLELFDYQEKGGYIQFISREFDDFYQTKNKKRFIGDKIYTVDEIPKLFFPKIVDYEYLKNVNIKLLLFSSKGSLSGWAYLPLSQLLKVDMGTVEHFGLDFYLHSKKICSLKGEYMIEEGN